MSPSAPWLAAAAAMALSGIREVQVPDPTSFWIEGGFHELVPSVRLPTTHDRRDVITVWMRLPEEGRIDVRPRAGSTRPDLVYPPGTRLDRTEYLRIEEGSPALTVTDVRGTMVAGDGRQRFHVLRPVSGRPFAPLVGWEWERGDEDGHEEATSRLLEHARETPNPIGRPPYAGPALARLAALNDCASCHRPNLDGKEKVDEAGPARRPTDAAGFYVPLAVLEDRVEIADHRPEDLNAADPFVRVTCGKQPAERRRRNGIETFFCPDGNVPVGERDVPTGLAANDPYTRRLCRSREYLRRHMTDAARAVFRDAFEACSLPRVPAEASGARP